MGTKRRNTHYYSLKSSMYASKPTPKLWRRCAPGLCGIQGTPPTAAPFLTQWVFHSEQKLQKLTHTLTLLTPAVKAFHTSTVGTLPFASHVSSSVTRELPKDLYFSWLLTYRAKAYWGHFKGIQNQDNRAKFTVIEDLFSFSCSHPNLPNNKSGT